MSQHPAFKRHSLVWWVLLISFLVFGVPRIYDKISRDVFKFQGESMGAKRKKAQSQIMAVQEALEAYKNEYGNYPRPVGGTNDPVTVAKMLYQAVTGDGTAMIDGASPTTSDGNPGTDGEFFLEASIRGRGQSSFTHEGFYLMDSWGIPFGYRRGNESSDTHNTTTFDLWSHGAVIPGDDAKQWITNWQQ
jgi:hypothetical protein